MFQPNLRAHGIMAVIFRSSIRALQRRLMLIREFATIGVVKHRMAQVNKFGAECHSWSPPD